MINKKEIYKEFCSRNIEVPIFLQPWWIDAVKEDNDWDVSLAHDKSGEIVGIMPYLIKPKLRQKISRMPSLTPFLGPWLLPYRGDKRHGLYSYENKVLSEIIKALPEFTYFSQKFSPAIENWYPFFLKGYEQTTSYTYILNDISDHDIIWDGMKNTVRTVIRKAEENLSIMESRAVEELYRLQKSTFSRQGIKVPYSIGVLHEIYMQSKERGQCNLFMASDKHDDIHAGLLLVWDSQVAYNLVIGVEEKFKNSGAVQLLIWHAIQFASDFVCRFNFEGTMLPHIEPVFRHFGETGCRILEYQKIKTEP